MKTGIRIDKVNNELAWVVLTNNSCTAVTDIDKNEAIDIINQLNESFNLNYQEFKWERFGK